MTFTIMENYLGYFPIEVFPIIPMVIPYRSFKIRKMSMSIHWTKRSSSYKKLTNFNFHC